MPNNKIKRVVLGDTTYDIALATDPGNQKVKSGSVVFGDNVTVDIVADQNGHTTVSGDASNNSITISSTWRDIKNDLTSTDTDKSLSALQGKVLHEKDVELEGRIDNIESRGRYLSGWNAETGKPDTYPTVPSGQTSYTYTFRTGDYYIVSAIGSTNLKPAGASISTTDGGSTWTVGSESETNAVQVGDIYTYDGTGENWNLTHTPQVQDTNQKVSVDVPGGTPVTFDQNDIVKFVAGDNTTIVGSTVGKTITISSAGTSYTAGTGIDISDNTISVDNTIAKVSDITAHNADASAHATLFAAKQNVIDASHKLSADYVSGLSVVATSNDYDDLDNKPSIPTVSQTFDATSEDAMSGKAIAGQAEEFDINDYVGVSATGTATDEVQYITIGGVEKKLAGGGGETYSAGTGLSLDGTTFNHSNSVSAVSSTTLLKVAYDAQGHITSTSAVTAADIASLGFGVVTAGAGAPSGAPVSGVYPALYIDTTNKILYYCLSGSTWVALGATWL